MYLCELIEYYRRQVINTIFHAEFDILILRKFLITIRKHGIFTNYEANCPLLHIRSIRLRAEAEGKIYFLEAEKPFKL